MQKVLPGGIQGFGSLLGTDVVSSPVLLPLQQQPLSLRRDQPVSQGNSLCYSMPARKMLGCSPIARPDSLSCLYSCSLCDVKVEVG